MDRNKVDSRVEALCRQGCDVVREAIAALEGGRGEMGLTAGESEALRAELRDIMAVYDRGPGRVSESSR